MSEREEYTPTLDEILGQWAADVFRNCHRRPGETEHLSFGALRDAADRAIAAHDAELREKLVQAQATIHVLASERDAALARNDDLLAALSADPTDAEVEAATRGRLDALIRNSEPLDDDEWEAIRSTSEIRAMRAGLVAARKAAQR